MDGLRNVPGFVSAILGLVWVTIVLFRRPARRPHRSTFSKMAGWFVVIAGVVVAAWFGSGAVNSVSQGGRLLSNDMAWTVGWFLYALGWAVLLIREGRASRLADVPAGDKRGKEDNTGVVQH